MKEKKKDEKKEIIKENLEVLPIRHYDDNLGGFFLADSNRYMDILEIVPKDRKNMQDDELKYEIFNLAKFYKLYSEDLKFISLNFPVNTSKQRETLHRAVRKTADEVRKKWLEREITELEKLDKNVNRREFFLIFYGRSHEDFQRNKTNVLEWIGYGKSRLVKEISKEKKIQIVRKLCNMNSLILPEDLKLEKGERADEFI